MVSEFLLCILLVLTTFWCILLTKRLSQLRVDRGDVAMFVEAVEVAAARAESATAGIRTAAAEAQTGLERQRATIEARIAELTRLTEESTQSARRLDMILHRFSKIRIEYQRLGKDDLKMASVVSAGNDAVTSHESFPPEQNIIKTVHHPSLNSDILMELETIR